jgi:hypothetical protein
MDRQIWKVLVCAVRSADRRAARSGRRPCFSDQQILKMYFWSVIHDRPLCWACDRSHYNGSFRPRQLPSISQFCRRMKTPRIAAMSDAVNEYLTRTETPVRLSFFDGKALPISDYSTDPDARDGHGVGKFQRGYKLHAWATSEGFIPRFSVRSMNEGEQKVARELTDRIERNSLVLADSNFDSRYLYQDVAERGGQLLTPLKGRSTQEKNLKQMGPGRRNALAWWTRSPRMCEKLLRYRDQIERIFAALTGFGGGLTTLPAWVRRIDRVRGWVTAKIAIYHARLVCKKSNAA